MHMAFAQLSALNRKAGSIQSAQVREHKVPHFIPRTMAAAGLLIPAAVKMKKWRLWEVGEPTWSCTEWVVKWHLNPRSAGPQPRLQELRCIAPYKAS